MKQCEKCQTENYDEAAYCKNCGHILEMGKSNQVVKFQTTFHKLNIITVWSFRVLIFATPLLIASFILMGHFGNLLWSIEIQYTEEYNKIYNLIPAENRSDYYYIYNINYDEARKLLISYVGSENAEPLIKLNNEYLDAESKHVLFTSLSIIFEIFHVSLPLLIAFFFIYNKRWKKFYLNSDLKNAKERLTSFAFSQNTINETVKIRENPKDELRLKDKSLGAKGYFHLVTDKEGNVLLIGEKYNTQSLIRTVFGKDINFIEK